MTTAEATVEWPIELEIDVAWGDMDSFAHVNNVVYLRWFESARIRLFEATGVLARMETERVGPILARTSCDYLQPVAYPDTVTVRTRCTRLGNSSFDMAYEVVSSALGKVCATGDAVIVMVDYNTGRSAQLGEALRAKLAEVS